MAREELTEEQMELQENLEHPIVLTYRQYPEWTDYGAMRVVDALITHYKAIAANREPKYQFLTGPDVACHEALFKICEWQIGNPTKFTNPEEPGRTISVESLLEALRRMRKLMDHWNKTGGRRGYIEFIAPYATKLHGTTKSIKIRQR